MTQNYDSARAHFYLDAHPPLEADSGESGEGHIPSKESLKGGLLPFLFKGLIWGLITYFLAKEFAVNQFWIVVLSVFLFSIPITLCGIYGNTIRQIRRLTFFAKRGWIFRVLSGRALKVIFWTFWGLGSSFFMLVQFHTYNDLEWIVFFLVVPVYWIIFSMSHKLIAGELKSYIVANTALVLARLLCPLVMLVIYVALAVHVGETPAYSSLQEAVNAQKAAVEDMTGSALVWEVSQYLAFYDGAKAYALGRLEGQDALLALLLLGIGGFVVFYNACAILSCFLIPGAEYRRVFGPLSDADQPKPIPPFRIAAIVAVTTFLALFVYLPLFAYIEAWLQQTPEAARARQRVESWGIAKIDKSTIPFSRQAPLRNFRMPRLRRCARSMLPLQTWRSRLIGRSIGWKPMWMAILTGITAWWASMLASPTCWSANLKTT
jgi:hypothetical protein